jgi:hypothetical protein
LFAEVRCLPSIVFPFVKLFRGRPAAAFEASATFLTNWGTNWFDMFPHPPLHHLAEADRVLRHHDIALQEHLSQWDGGAPAVIWDLSSSLLTDVLRREQWLKVHSIALLSFCMALENIVAAIVIETTSV